jgi:hypothetical protein
VQREDNVTISITAITQGVAKGPSAAGIVLATPLGDVISASES